MSFFRRRPPSTPPKTPPGGAGRGPGGPPGPSALEIVTAYHERTKHHAHRFASSAGFLDWDNQPDPFRRHEGAPLHALPRPQVDRTPPYDALFVPGSVPARALTPESLSEFFYFSLALSAWKRAGEAHWSLRVNPSSGNLHPTEGWALLPAVPGLSHAPGLHHYQPREHALAARATWREPDFAALQRAALGGELPARPPHDAGAAQAGGAPDACFFVALSSIPWRESWKYGERAWRYCQHDVGHALAALAFAAALQGWRLRCLPAVEDAALGAVLGLDRSDGSHPEEPEHPDLLALVECAPVAGAQTPLASGEPQAPHTLAAQGDASPRDTSAALRALAQHAQWAGRANLCSPEHREWDVIEVVEAATRKDAAWCAEAPARLRAEAARTGGVAATADSVDRSGFAADTLTGAPDDAPSAPGPRSAGAVIRGRRSAVALDGHTGLTAPGLCDLLARLMPAALPQPWSALGMPPLVDLVLFVHRVRDVEPGLYALVRAASRLPDLRASCTPELLWTHAPAAPPSLPLYLLRAGNAQSLATSVSCGQDIAGRGAFSLGMLASFAPALARHGAPMYRHLFWETGFLGQILYLEAEALGVAGTGIGCFFDDSVHQALGLADRSAQSLYHFTIGGAVLDDRLTTEAAYEGPGLP